MAKCRIGNSLVRFRIAVNSLQNGEPAGTFRTAFLPGEIPFSGITALVGELHHYMDTLDYPQSPTRLRSFSGQPDKTHETEKGAVRYMEDSTLEIKAGEKATFVVQVLFRQNSTWQGTITWTEKGETQKFRSTLELLKLMDSAVSGTEECAHWE